MGGSPSLVLMLVRRGLEGDRHPRVLWDGPVGCPCPQGNAQAQAPDERAGGSPWGFPAGWGRKDSHEFRQGGTQGNTALLEALCLVPLEHQKIILRVLEAESLKSRRLIPQDTWSPVPPALEEEEDQQALRDEVTVTWKEDITRQAEPGQAAEMREGGHGATLQGRGQECCPEVIVTAQRRGEGT